MNDKITAVGLSELLREAKAKHVAKSHELADIALQKFKQLIESNLSNPFCLGFEFLAVAVLEISFENSTINVSDELDFRHDLRGMFKGLDSDYAMDAFGLTEEALDPFYEYLNKLGFDFAYDDRKQKYYITLEV